MRNKTRSSLTITAIVSAIAVMVSCSKSYNNNSTPLKPEVSFRTGIVPILHANCALNVDCHSGPKNMGDNIDLDDAAAYNTIVNKQLVMADNPTQSLLYVEISEGIMPKAPYPPLIDSQIIQILTWIQQGAKNN